MATKKEVLTKCQEAIGHYFQTSQFLFGENAPYDVKEIPKDSPFYETARSIAEEMELSWEEMTHEDSTRVMLNMLADAYAAIEPDGHYDAVLTISFKKAE